MQTYNRLLILVVLFAGLTFLSGLTYGEEGEPPYRISNLEILSVASPLHVKIQFSLNGDYDKRTAKTQPVLLLVCSNGIVSRSAASEKVNAKGTNTKVITAEFISSDVTFAPGSCKARLTIRDTAVPLREKRGDLSNPLESTITFK